MTMTLTGMSEPLTPDACPDRPLPQVAYLTVPARRRPTKGPAKDADAPLDRPIPTFGVGKATPRGYPSMALRTRLVGHPVHVRRPSLARTKSLGEDYGSGGPAQAGCDAQSFNPEMLAIPTLYLPPDSDGGSEEEEEEDASDLVTIPSSYMLPSVQGLTDIRSVSDQASQADSGPGWKVAPHPRRTSAGGVLPGVAELDAQRARRGSSVSVVFGRPEMPTMGAGGGDGEEHPDGCREQGWNQQQDPADHTQQAGDYPTTISDKRPDFLDAGDRHERNSERGFNTTSSKTLPQEAYSNAPGHDDDAHGYSKAGDQLVTVNAVNQSYRPFVPPPDAVGTLQGFVDPLTSYRVRLARRKRKQKTTDVSPDRGVDREAEDSPDGLAILRAAMNRARRREGQSEGSVSEKVTPLTLVSVQRQHLLTTRPALLQTGAVPTPRPQPPWDPTGPPPDPGQEVGTGYLSLEKFGFVCQWVRTVEELREKGLLDGDPVTEMELMWSFGEDYVPNQGGGIPHVPGGEPLHRGSI